MGLGTIGKEVLKWVVLNDQQREVVVRTETFVKDRLHGADSGHDWWHIYRVVKLARTIAKEEKVNQFVVELSALLHDIADAKFHNGDESIGPETARFFLEQQGLDHEIVEHVVSIITHMSFRKEISGSTFRSPEFDVVQDADRLDAIGAIGIARAFSYGGYKRHMLYDPHIKPVKNPTGNHYKKINGPTINHFYEKLLTLKDRMKTATGRALAERRHDYMIGFLNEFYREWEGEF